MLRIFLLFFFYSSAVYSSSPCGGRVGSFHVNPDNSAGGFVEKSASVEKSVYVDQNSKICDQAKVKSNSKIINGSTVEGFSLIEESSIVDNSQILENAMIQNFTTIKNSRVCQKSLLTKALITNSTFFCQTEDPQPKDPGKDGRLSLEGIDRDADGVRDDVEIFINNEISNKVNQNRANERISSKLYAKLIQKQVIKSHIREFNKRVEYLKVELLTCYPETISEEVVIQSMDTKMRLYAYLKAVGYSHGEEFESFDKKKCKGLNELNKQVDAL